MGFYFQMCSTRKGLANRNMLLLCALGEFDVYILCVAWNIKSFMSQLNRELRN